MKKLFLPLLVNKGTVQETKEGPMLCHDMDPYKMYYDEAEAREAAKELVLRDPKAKVVVFEAKFVIEPRKIEFAEKTYTPEGELIV